MAERADRIGIDTNVLIHAALPSLPGHAAVRRYLEALLDSQAILVVTPAILHELLHVVTDPRRFEPALTMEQAVALARSFVGRGNVEILAADEVATALALDWVERFRLGRKRLADTLLAAVLSTQGVRRLVTLNGRDFQLFPQLEVLDPTADGVFGSSQSL